MHQEFEFQIESDFHRNKFLNMYPLVMCLFPNQKAYLRINFSCANVNHLGKGKVRLKFLKEILKYQNM